MRLRSGGVRLRTRLVSFLYELARDHLPTGLIERVVENIQIEQEDMIDKGEDPNKDLVASNGWLAKWAGDVAMRLDTPNTIEKAEDPNKDLVGREIYDKSLFHRLWCKATQSGYDKSEWTALSTQLDRLIELAMTAESSELRRAKVREIRRTLNSALDEVWVKDQSGSGYDATRWKTVHDSVQLLSSMASGLLPRTFNAETGSGSSTTPNVTEAPLPQVAVGSEAGRADLPQAETNTGAAMANRVREPARHLMWAMNPPKRDLTEEENRYLSENVEFDTQPKPAPGQSVGRGGLRPVRVRPENELDFWCPGCRKLVGENHQVDCLLRQWDGAVVGLRETSDQLEQLWETWGPTKKEVHIG